MEPEFSIHGKRLGFVAERVGYLLHRADLLHMQLIREALNALGLTPARATALAFVHENPGCRQNDLGLALAVNRSSAMELVNSLVALGAMERKASADKRANALFLTARGDVLFEQFLAISQGVDDVITGSLNGTERKALVEILAKISANLDAALKSGSGQMIKARLYLMSEGRK